jgi:hypothetical protein
VNVCIEREGLVNLTQVTPPLRKFYLDVKTGRIGLAQAAQTFEQGRRKWSTSPAQTTDRAGPA